MKTYLTILISVSLFFLSASIALAEDYVFGQPQLVQSQPVQSQPDELRQAIREVNQLSTAIFRAQGQYFTNGVTIAELTKNYYAKLSKAETLQRRRH